MTIITIWRCDHCYREERFTTEEEADRNGWIHYQGLDFDDWDCLFDEFPDAPRNDHK